MTLSEFIASDLETMVADWEAFARTRLPAAHDLSPEDLRDHAAVMLREIAADLASQQAEPDARVKSRGLLPDNSPRLTTAAHAHAMQRFAQGFTVNQMVSEYRALRAAVIQRWTLQLDEVSTSELDELVRFGESVDQAMTESVSVHLDQIEKSRNLLLGVLGHDLRNPLGAVRMTAEYLLRANGLDGLQTKAVSVLVRGEKHEVMVKVHNEGPPIPEETRCRLFKPLVSQPSSREIRHTGSSGMGLGLYIAHEIVIAHRGTLLVSSTAHDGTAFTVRLPRMLTPPDT